MQGLGKGSLIGLIVLILLLLAGIFLVRQIRKGPVWTPQPTVEPSPPAPTPTVPQTPTETPSPPSDLSEIYKGFKQLERGDWAEWKIYKNGNIFIMRYVFAGEDTIDGELCVGFELKGEVSDLPGVSAFQWWISKQTGLPVKAYIETEGGVFVVTYGEIRMGIYGPEPQHGTPVEYRPENIINYEIGVFTTETGKTVRVVKVYLFIAGYEKPLEHWVSEEVPFGLVKIISPKGEVQMELRDFGSGAEIQITKEEREKAKKIPTGYP
ncbi:MAG TPA: hypothetical protein EYP68_01350 [Candidatus Korarchaeota archaeon]|nr:hypothetical protein [Candidatus Korarchaeota archaeon]